MTNQYSQGRKAGVKLTSKFLDSFLEKLHLRHAEDKTNDKERVGGFSEGGGLSQSFNEKEDLKLQIEMIKSLAEAVKTKEALTQAEEKEAQDRAVQKNKEKQREQEEEASESLTQDGWVQKLRSSFVEHGITIPHENHLQDVVKRILQEGHGADHSGSDKNAVGRS
ncbi:MAG: hypothetical protein KA100_00905 [Rickettsiales bacterium]|nr:hypothetical protein [Rickettsiales bacterium]